MNNIHNFLDPFIVKSFCFSKVPGKLGRRKVQGKIGLRYCQFNVTLVSIAAKKSKVPRKLRGNM